MNMSYIWDRRKAEENLKKHGIHFADAVSALFDDLALTIEDAESSESRWVTVGMDHFGRILVVVFTWRDDEVRLISARKATPGERKQYEGKK